MGIIEKLQDPTFWEERCLNDLFFLCRNVIQTVEDTTPGLKELDPPTHRLLCQFIEKNALPGQKLLILMPRGWAKSYIVTCGWLIQRMLRNWTTGRRETWIINNATLPNAIKFLERNKYNLTYNDLLRELFKQYIPKFPESEAVRWTEREINILGTAVETGSAEGNLVSRHYPGGVINDDLVNRDNSANKTQIEVVVDFWRLSQSLMLPSAIEFLLGTRWNLDDLYGYIISEFLKIPDEAMKHYRKDPYFEWHNGKYHLFHCSCWGDPATEGGSTFPKIYPNNRIKELKNEQQERFGGQYLNDPMALSQKAFKSAWWRNRWQVGTLPANRLNILLCDPANKDKKESDFTGLVDIEAGTDKRMYVKSAVRKQVTDSKAVEWIIETALKHQPMMIGIEENKFNVFKELMEFLIPQMAKQGKVPMELYGYALRMPRLLIELQHHSRPKELRIGNLCGYFEQGLVILAPYGMEDLIDEAMRFNPNGSTSYDDLLDALAYALDVVVFPKTEEDIPRLIVPEEYKQTAEQREEQYWDTLPLEVSGQAERHHEEFEEETGEEL